MRLLIQHRNHYRYPSTRSGEGAALGPQIVRLRPANHTRAKVEAYSLQVVAEGAGPDATVVRWQQDPYGNHVARITFKAGERVRSFELSVELAVDIHPVNPFDFFIDDRCKSVPFEYPGELRHDLLPFMDTPAFVDPALATGPRFERFVEEIPRSGKTVDFLVACNQAVNHHLRYVIREETGIWTPEETLAEARGSCRDSATLLMAVFRRLGLAARFVSGYLVQLTDEGMIPDAPRGVGRDVVDLHAWAEVYLPGAGWIGLDATSGLLCGEGHIPLACTASPALAAPIEGTSDVAATDVSFAMSVRRLGHEARPTTPYTDEIWDEMQAAARRGDEHLAERRIAITIGGEPTFNAREQELTTEPEWNTAALGASKWSIGTKLVEELRKRIAPGAALLLKQGKHYPGESLPRWALEVCGRKDGRPLWPERPSLVTQVAGEGPGAGVDEARRFGEQLAIALGLPGSTIAAFEDPWRFLQDEANLPIDVDPLEADLDDGEERRRLARVLGRGLGVEAGFVLPLANSSQHGEGAGWLSERWEFRRGHLFLIPGDSPIGLRLPLRSLPPGEPPPLPVEEPYAPPDPRQHTGEDAEDLQQARLHMHARRTAVSPSVRTALCVEARAGRLYVFLPPLQLPSAFFELVAAVDATRESTNLDVQLEGYGPPPGADLLKFAVTPDPGVLEVNLPPVESSTQYITLLEHVFDAALHAGLHSEKYLVDGRLAGSGGGNHLTFGGHTPLASPFLRRPDLLASLITFAQHHPSLSYLFTGLFVGPTSQAPRVDEARHDSLYELEIALERAFASHPKLGAESTPPWLPDLLLRNLLVDVAGNTHRTEICLDKLFDPQTPTGRQGLIELRAFEMPPHPRLAVAQMILVRQLLAAFVDEPYSAPLVRWGQTLHDRFLLPYWLWRDFGDVLAFLDERGLPLPADAYKPFLDLRCPLVGTLQAGDVLLEVRNAIEPWPVLGEEQGQAGTARYVDSSMERIEVRASGLIAERHAVLVNGHVLPLRPTTVAEEFVGGVRFRAWAPPHSLQAHLGIHHPIRLDVVDTWGRRSLGACAYHVWHPEGRGYDAPPLTRFEADARRSSRYTVESQLQWPVNAEPLATSGDTPFTVDLRRSPIDRPMPEPTEESE